jgi:hypothetical protein
MLGKISAFSVVRPIGSTRLGPSIKERIIHPSPLRPLGTNLFNWPELPTQILVDIHVRVYLGSTRNLRDTTHNMKLDCAPEVSGTRNIRAPEATSPSTASCMN